MILIKICLIENFLQLGFLLPIHCRDKLHILCTLDTELVISCIKHTQGIPPNVHSFSFIMFICLCLSSVYSKWRPYFFIATCIQSYTFCVLLPPFSSFWLPFCHPFGDCNFFHSYEMPTYQYFYSILLHQCSVFSLYAQSHCS